MEYKELKVFSHKVLVLHLRTSLTEPVKLEIVFSTKILAPAAQEWLRSGFSHFDPELRKNVHIQPNDTKFLDHLRYNLESKFNTFDFELVVF